MFEDLPYRKYLSVLIVQCKAKDVNPELKELGLPGVPEKLLIVARKDKSVLKETLHKLLHTNLLDLKSTRFRAARETWIYVPVRQRLQLILLDAEIEMSDVLKEVHRIGRTIGLTVQMIQDFKTLFWDFDGVPQGLRQDVLRKLGATEGLLAASLGHMEVGKGLDLGFMPGAGSADRLRYINDIVFRKFLQVSARPMSIEDGRDLNSWVQTVVGLEREIRDIEPEQEDVMRLVPEFILDAGVVQIPHIDHLPLLDKEGTTGETIELDSQVIPFHKKEKK